MCRTDEDDAGALLPGLPDGVSGLYSVFLGQIILGYHDTSPHFRVTGYCHGYSLVLRMVYGFAGGEKVVAVAVEDDTLCEVHFAFASLKNTGRCLPTRNDTMRDSVRQSGLEGKFVRLHLYGRESGWIGWGFIGCAVCASGHAGKELDIFGSDIKNESCRTVICCIGVVGKRP